MKISFSLAALVCTIATQTVVCEITKPLKKQEDVVVVANNPATAQNDEKCSGCGKEDAEQVKPTEVASETLQS